MNPPTVNDIDSETDTQFVTEADWIPSFWNYLLDLDRDDLIAELVQNDLDQDATRTVISFERDRVICEGNGRPVEADGWKRLRKIQGAGDSVPAKCGKIGVKNHGLKTAFTIGDEIRLLSANQAVTQTLYANGRNKPPLPGASAEPQPDSQAPEQGCRIIIRYRDTNISPPQGEANLLAAIPEKDIDTLFLSACASTPEQFAGIVSPEVAPRYEVVIRHWRLGEARFVFSCTRPRGITKRIELFRRRCTVTGSVTPLPDGLQEQAARRLIPLKGRLRERVADFFRRGKRFFIEVSWPIDGRGKPKTGTGRFRYPIGFPLDSHEALTGHSANFNAPIASDNKRHGPARNEETNKELRAHCVALLIDVLARRTVPRWAADGLGPLVPNLDADNHDQAVRPILSALIRQGAMPTLKWRNAVARLAKTKKIKAPPAKNPSTTRSAYRPKRKYKFVIPVVRRRPEVIHPSLSVITPRSELQIDPRTHPNILKLLADSQTDGFGDQFVTFDEHDALTRAAGEGNQHFDALPVQEDEFGDPFLAHAYLSVIDETLTNDECDTDTENQLLESLQLPDVHGIPTRLEDLYASAPLPSDVPGLRVPPILHGDLASHRLFKRRKWRRPNYTMAAFLKSGTLQTADENTRRRFWNWLHRNTQHITPRERPKLADITIWPDRHGHLCTLSELCDPHSQRVATVLGDFIRKPHEQVRNSKLVSTSRKSKTSIRQVPSESEIRDWLDKRMEAYPFGATPDSATVAGLYRFETDVVTLFKNPGIARLLKGAQMTLPALAKDATIQPRTTLVIPSPHNDRLALLDRFLLNDKKNPAMLGKLSPALSGPTADMLLATFAEDSTNFTALQPRLQHFLSITELGDAERLRLADMPLVPVDGQACPAAKLAFTGSKGDYWGDWKTRISGKGLSQEDQRRYRAAGVTSASPNRETSRKFFEWLSRQNRSVLDRHITCVFRHILHRDGPTHWAETFTDTAFIPTKGQDGLRIVSLRTARRRPVFLPDAPELGEAIIAKDPGVQLVVYKVKEVREPIAESLRKLGIRSLREEIKEPEYVSGAGNIVPATEHILDQFDHLRSRTFQRTFLKRIDALGVDKELVRRDWHDRLSKIEGISFADQVETRYRFRGKPYSVQARGGFDLASGIFWMARGSDIVLSSLYESIAAQLVFKPTARPVHLLALERTAVLEIQDPSFEQPTGRSSNLESDETVDDESDHDNYGMDENQDDEDTDPGEAVFGHSPFEPDTTRNTPNPASIPPRVTRSSRRQWQGGTSTSGSDLGSGETRSAPDLEREHIEALKRNHYASHCQMCLCVKSPEILAPAGSYIQWEEVRRRIVEAHHPDLKSAGGARHAGNLILLCKLHHDNYGRRLTRTAISDSLGSHAKDKIVHFGVDDDSRCEVKGRMIEIVLPDTGEIVRLFFTKEHSEYWLSQVTRSPTSNVSE